MSGTASTDSPDSDQARRVPGLAEYTGALGVTVPVGGRLETRLDLRVVGPHVPIGEPTVETRAYSVLDLGWRAGRSPRGAPSTSSWATCSESDTSSSGRAAT